MKIKNGKVVLYFPSLFYDVAQWAFFPVNYVISVACHFQPKKSVWNDEDFDKKEIKGSGKSLDDIKKDILEEKNVSFDEEDIVLLYDSLPAVTSHKDVIGRSWKGRIVRTNASVLDVGEWLLVRTLGLLGLKWGKRFRTDVKGDPLQVRWFDRFYFPLPIWGNVSIIDIKWRGVTTATMVYDHQPWKDYFKLLSDENGKFVLLGVWTHKDIAGGWFTLTFDPDVVT